VVAAVLDAGSEKAAAHRLGLSHSTVKHHLANAPVQGRGDDDGPARAGSGKGVVAEAVIAASIALDDLLLRGDLAEQNAAGIRFRAGTRP
jgi:hypothetical protein